MRMLCGLGLACCLVFPISSTVAESPANTASAPPGLAFGPRIRKAFDQSGKGVVHRTLPDGSSVAEHNATLGHVTLARIGPDGRIETYCTNDEANAGAWLSRAAETLMDSEPSEPESGEPR